MQENQVSNQFSNELQVREGGRRAGRLRTQSRGGESGLRDKVQDELGDYAVCALITRAPDQADYSDGHITPPCSCCQPLWRLRCLKTNSRERSRRTKMMIQPRLRISQVATNKSLCPPKPQRVPLRRYSEARLSFYVMLSCSISQCLNIFLLLIRGFNRDTTLILTRRAKKKDKS
jgi:hypothetical protein